MSYLSKRGSVYYFRRIVPDDLRLALGKREIMLSLRTKDIAPRKHRSIRRTYDVIAYRHRWGIEAFFARLKQWRRIATRYDKLAANFLGFIKLASIMLWLK